jgi:hypothetical protein
MNRIKFLYLRSLHSKWGRIGNKQNMTQEVLSVWQSRLWVESNNWHCSQRRPSCGDSWVSRCDQEQEHSSKRKELAQELAWGMLAVSGTVEWVKEKVQDVDWEQWGLWLEGTGGVLLFNWLGLWERWRVLCRLTQSHLPFRKKILITIKSKLRDRMTTGRLLTRLFIYSPLLGVVAHTWNPSYSGGGDWEDCGSRPG